VCNPTRGKDKKDSVALSEKSPYFNPLCRNRKGFNDYLTGEIAAKGETLRSLIRAGPGMLDSPHAHAKPWAWHPLDSLEG